MYLYNTNNYLREINREEIKQRLCELNAKFEDLLNGLGYNMFEVIPYEDGNGLIVMERQKWFDRDLENPNKDMVCGVILYYTLVGDDICYFTSFKCSFKELNIEDSNFGTVTPLFVERDSHFKKMRQFQERLFELFPKVKKIDNAIFYKNNYLLMDSFPASNQFKYEVSETLRKIDKFEDVRYVKNRPVVSFKFEGNRYELLIRKYCLMLNGIIYPDVESFIESFPKLNLKDFLSDAVDNSIFIDYTSSAKKDYYEDFLFKENMREMEEGK